MSKPSSSSTPFLRFEGDYHAYHAAAQEAETKLSPSNSQTVLRLMSIALLQSFERFCIEQSEGISKLRPGLVREIRPDQEPIIGKTVNVAFEDLLGKNVLSRTEVIQFRQIRHQSYAPAPEMETAGLAVPLPIAWAPRFDAVFDLAVKIARATGTAATVGLDPKLKNYRNTIAAATRLLQARFDSLA